MDSIWRLASVSETPHALCMCALPSCSRTTLSVSLFLPCIFNPFGVCRNLAVTGPPISICSTLIDDAAATASVVIRTGTKPLSPSQSPIAAANS